MFTLLLNLHLAKKVYFEFFKTLFLGGYQYLKWIYSNDSDSYFEKKSPKTWMKFKNLKFVTQYEEIEQINKSILTAILKSDDQHFVKLTNRALYTGGDKLRINFFKNYGSWSSQRDKCDGYNLKLKIPGRVFLSFLYLLS